MAEQRLPLRELDEASLPAQAVARALLVGTRLPLRQHDPAIVAQVEAIEHLLLERHAHDFAARAWHGPTSLQRVVWQCREVIGFIAERGHVEAIVERRQRADERELGGGFTLSGALIEGLATNRPSYLLTACPNWRLRPRRVEFRKLSDMAVSDVQDAPFLVHADDLTAAMVSLRAIGALRDVIDDAVVPSETEELSAAVDLAPDDTLLGAAGALLDLPSATKLVGTVANASTALERMSGQCLEVMHDHAALLAAESGSHERVLGYGLMSHALDAKHLAAVLVHALKHGHTRYRLIDDDTAIEAVRALLDGFVGGTLGVRGGQLMRARFQQMLRLIIDRRAELGVSADRIRQALTSR